MGASRSLKLVQYSAPLDIQVLRFADLRKRAKASNWPAAPHRVDFCHWVLATSGEFTHMVDFVPQPCRAGSWLTVKPGQVHAFDLVADWDGWLVVFKPEALPPAHERSQLDEVESLFDALPTMLAPPAEEHRAAQTIIEQMVRDAERYQDPAEGNRLMRAALFYLLLRAQACVRQYADPRLDIGPSEFHRFVRFKKQVELDMRTQRHVQDYASKLGCSEKSLNRAVLAVSGVTAKTYLTQRMVLEAKRLLVHTAQPIGSIGLDLGFEDPTNFVKFFKREAGLLPTAFRQSYAMKNP